MPSVIPFLLATLFLARNPPALMPDRGYGRGNAELRIHRYKDAIASYTRAAELDNSSAAPILGIAAVHFVGGQRDAAIAEYKAGIVRFPNEARLYIAYSEMLLGSSDSLKLQAEAANLLEKAMNWRHNQRKLIARWVS